MPQAKPLIPLMESSGFTDFARMLKVAALDIDNEKVHAVGTLFVPTNEVRRTRQLAVGIGTHNIYRAVWYCGCAGAALAVRECVGQ
jgi:hypothetical protein